MRAEDDRGDWGREAGILSEGSLAILFSFGEILKVGTKNSIQNHPDPLFKTPKVKVVVRVWVAQRKVALELTLTLISKTLSGAHISAHLATIERRSLKRSINNSSAHFRAHF